jgi:pimeloyl-ACP methyl ester carboxylesterase
VVCGENDAFFPPSLHADLAAAIPAAVLAVIPEAGHIACADRPREFNDTVTDFLSRTLTAADRP